MTNTIELTENHIYEVLEAQVITDRTTEVDEIGKLTLKNIVTNKTEEYTVWGNWEEVEVEIEDAYLYVCLPTIPEEELEEDDEDNLEVYHIDTFNICLVKDGRAFKFIIQ